MVIRMLVVLVVAVLVIMQSNAREIHQLEVVHGGASAWTLSATGTLSFAFQQPDGHSSHTVIDIDLDGMNNAAPDAKGYFDRYVTHWPTFQIDPSSKRIEGGVLVYTMWPVDPFVRVYANDPSQGGASTALPGGTFTEIVRFRATANLNRLEIPFDTVAVLAPWPDIDLELDYVNPDASGFEFDSMFMNPDFPFPPGTPIPDAQAWQYAFGAYIELGGANLVGSLQLIAGGPSLSQAIDQGLALDNPARTSALFSIEPVENRWMWGDINHDGIVGTLDASLLLQWDAMLIHELPCCPGYSYPSFPPRADVNGDGMLGALDAASLLQFDAQLLPCLPVDLDCDGYGPEAP